MLSGGPTWSMADCANITNSIPNNTNHSSVSLRTHAGSSQLMQNMDFLTDKHPSENKQEHTERIYERFSAASPMGLSTFPIGNYRCLGPYDGNFSMRSTGSGGASWHPGKKGHQLRGDALAYFVLEMIVDAASTVRDLLCSPTIEASRRDVSKAQIAARAAAVVKTESVHNNATKSASTKNNTSAVPAKASHSLRRLSTFTPNPHSGSNTIEEAIWNNITSTLSMLTNIHNAVNLPTLTKQITSALHTHPEHHIDHSAVYMHSLCSAYLAYFHSLKLPAVSSHYDIPETTYPPTCYTDYLPRQKQDMSISNLIHPPKGKWTNELSWFDKNAVEKAERKKLGYLDRKYIYRSNGNGTSLGLHISTRHNAPLWLCELQKGFQQYPAYMSDLIDGAEITICLHFPFTTNSSSSSATLKTKVSVAKKVEIKHFVDQCYRTVSPVPAGEHLLMITQNAGKQINLAYIISW